MVRGPKYGYQQEDRSQILVWLVIGSTRKTLGKEMTPDTAMMTTSTCRLQITWMDGRPLTKQDGFRTNLKWQSSLAFFPVGINAREAVCILLMCITRASYYAVMPIITTIILWTDADSSPLMVVVTRCHMDFPTLLGSGLLRIIVLTVGKSRRKKQQKN